MKKLLVSLFSIEDLNEIEPREEEIFRLESMKKPPQSFAYTFRHEGKVIFAGGLVMSWPGMGEMWLICDKCIDNFKKELLYATSSFIESWIKVHKLHRIQATVCNDFREGKNFLKKLGFRPEGLLRKYDSQKKDYYMYSRII